MKLIIYLLLPYTLTSSLLHDALLKRKPDLRKTFHYEPHRNNDKVKFIQQQNDIDNFIHKDENLKEAENFIAHSPRQNEKNVRNLMDDFETRRGRVHREERKKIYQQKRIAAISSESSGSTSSGEQKNWREEWKDTWMKKKLEALNASVPAGDFVNMVAARPWGVPCGDPSQHDMPWGSCMLPMECEAEFRIYRGDYFCGKTQYVCCALQVNTYDTNLGFDISFENSAYATDSEEIKERYKKSNEKQARDRRKEKRRRRSRRRRRKRKIQRTIDKILKEIRRILNRHYRNRTREITKKTKELKQYITYLKKKYKRDRLGIKDLHEIEIVKIDAMLYQKLKNMDLLNRNIFGNETFRELIKNHTISKKNLRSLVETYPELIPYVKLQGANDEGNTNFRRNVPPQSEELIDYDIEYGYLYY